MKLQGSYRDIVRPQYPTFRGRAQDDVLGPASRLSKRSCAKAFTNVAGRSCISI